MKILKVKRGQVYYADLSPVIGSEQGGMRPVLIIQNDVGNLHSPTTIVATMTSKMGKHPLPTHVKMPLFVDSLILCEQLRTIDKSRLKGMVAELNEETMAQVDRAIRISLEV